jgi:hypothetical protein
MARQQHQPEEQSLIPIIQETESGLKRDLEQARAQVKAEARDAERAAQLDIEKAGEEIPLRMQARHQEEIARLRAGIRPGSAEQEEVQRRAESNFRRAVQAIVDAVWGR